MNYHRLTKSMWKMFFVKIAGLKVKLPKEEGEQIRFLLSLCENWENNEDIDIETYLKMNGVVLLTIWFSNADYDIDLQQTALQNIVTQYEKYNGISEFLPAGVSIEGCYQMLIRNGVESHTMSKTQLVTLLERYKKVLGRNEEIAYLDELLNFQIHQGDFSQLDAVVERMGKEDFGEHCDCHACMMDRLVRSYLMRGDEAAAMGVIGFVFQEKLSCDRIPNHTYSQKLFAEHKLGLLGDDTQGREKEALKKLAKSSTELYEAYFLLTYANEKKNEAFAKEIMARFEPVLSVGDPPEKIAYCGAAYVASGLFFYMETGLALAEKFDQRNGNTYYSTLFARIVGAQA